MTAPTPSTPPVVALLTDFGDRDEYVGVMKGVILSRAPHTLVVDLCHKIAPHDIRQAAAMIASAYDYFPERTLFLMVVDPGVGSDRGIVYARAGGRGFICPDNGLLTGLLAAGVLDTAQRVTNAALFAASVSHTFHGRDIMAPVTGFLAAGGCPEQLGARQPLGDLVRLDDQPASRQRDGSLRGTVVGIDRFGNVVTDIGRELLTSVCEGDLNCHLIIEAGQRRVVPLVASYSARPPGELLATIGSRDTLEIAINQGNAARTLAIPAGTAVQVRPRAPE